MKERESTQANALKNATASVESANEDTVVSQVASIRLAERKSEKSDAIHQENVSERQIEEPSFAQRKTESRSLSTKGDEVNRATKTNTIVQENSQRKRDQNGGMALLGVLFSLAVLIMPPLLFSVGAYWLDVSALELTFIWIIWVAGIIAVLLLFSGLWPIILSCLIWNIVYVLTVGIIVLVNA